MGGHGWGEGWRKKGEGGIRTFTVERESKRFLREQKWLYNIYSRKHVHGNIYVIQEYHSHIQNRYHVYYQGLWGMHKKKKEPYIRSIYMHIFPGNHNK